jgi:hypothetical protein
VACSSTSSAPTHIDAATTDAARADAPRGRDAGHDSGRDATRRHSSADAADDASDGGEDVSEAPFDAAPYQPIDGGHALLTNMPSETWTWVPFPDSRCRDGSSTGLGLNFNPASPNLLIFLEEGGACFDTLSCGTTPLSFDGSDFAQRFPSAADGGTPYAGNGILDRTNSANAVADWNFVYVPYCTGDLHAGDNPAGMVPGVSGTQVFMGYQNLDLFLQRIVPTFASAKRVLLVGVSAGGFGAVANYVHVTRAFGPGMPVDMIDDSGPFMEAPYVTTCLQNEVRALWNLDPTVGADCGGACDDPQTFFIDVARHAITMHADLTFGLIESLDDLTITDFFGHGEDDCMVLGRESQALFTEGLNDIRTQFASNPNFGTFYFGGEDHTSLEGDTFYTRDTSTADGGSVLLTTWVASLVAGQASNAGP